METSYVTYNKFDIISVRRNLFYMHVKLNYIILSNSFSQILKAYLFCSTDA